MDGAEDPADDEAFMREGPITKKLPQSDDRRSFFHAFFYDTFSNWLL